MSHLQYAVFLSAQFTLDCTYMSYRNYYWCQCLGRMRRNSAWLNANSAWTGVRRLDFLRVYKEKLESKSNQVLSHVGFCISLFKKMPHVACGPAEELFCSGERCISQCYAERQTTTGG